MSLHRRNPRRDANEAAIVEVFRAAGFSVSHLSGTGVPDLMLSKAGKFWLIEVKAPKGRLQAAQVKWRQQFQGPPPAVVRSVDEAIAFTRAAREGSV